MGDDGLPASEDSPAPRKSGTSRASVSAPSLITLLVPPPPPPPLPPPPPVRLRTPPPKTLFGPRVRAGTLAVVVASAAALRTSHRVLVGDNHPSPSFSPSPPPPRVVRSRLLQLRRRRRRRRRPPPPACLGEALLSRRGRRLANFCFKRAAAAVGKCHEGGGTG